jgi:transcription antitermination protein NusB
VGSRRDARRTALDILYQADITGSDPADVLADWREAGREIPAFAGELVSGVHANIARIDQVLEEHALEWSVSRMAALDRTILRVATYELLLRPDIPPAAAISEAVEAANELSADESRRFVNGILGKIAREFGAGNAE